jgi:hypothetical protein
MPLDADIQDIQTGINAGRYANEAAVSQGIILRILHALGWQIFDASQVVPEFPLGAGRVDYALCYPPKRPVILVESKDVGRAVGSEKQLFEYAFHQGIPMAILTDGQEWSFFLPGEQGTYHERCVYKLDLVARPVAESAKIFQRYLAFSEVSAGRAINNAKDDYRTVARNRQIQDALPAAWAELLQEQDELLVELIADRAQTICGFKPEPELVAHFIKRVAQVPTPLIQASPMLGTTQQTRRQEPPSAAAFPTNPSLESSGTEFAGFAFNGQRYTEGNAINTLLRVFEVLSGRDQSFLDRYAALPKHGRKRRYLSRDKYDLYPDRRDLCDEYSVSKFGGWWVGTNYSRSTIRHAIELACQISNLRFGVDLKLI